jgi:hypothetical protein
MSAVNHLYEYPPDEGNAIGEPVDTTNDPEELDVRLEGLDQTAHYSLTEGAEILGVSEKTLAARLSKTGIQPTPDPLDRRRFLVTGAQLEYVSGVTRGNGAESSMPLRTLRTLIQGLLAWRKRTDRDLKEYKDNIGNLSEQVRRLTATMRILSAKVDTLTAGAYSDDIHEHVQLYLQPILDELTSVTAVLRQGDAEVAERIARLTASGRRGNIRYSN